MMIAWRDALNLHLTIREGILYVVAFWNGMPTLWGPPVGDNPSCADFQYGLDLIRTIADAGARPSVLYVWKEYNLWPWLLNGGPYHVSFQRNEYLYSVDVLARLNTPQLRKKRQERNRFERRFTPTVLPYDQALAGECIDLLERWTRYRRQAVPSEFVPKFEMEAQVCRDALAGGLKMQGVVVRVAGLVEAFSLGVRHASRCFNCLFEKTNYQIPGASAFVFSELARVLSGEYDKINAGGDWAVPYLATAKLSWRPSRIAQAFEVTEAANDPRPIPKRPSDGLSL